MKITHHQTKKNTQQRPQNEAPKNKTENKQTKQFNQTEPTARTLPNPQVHNVKTNKNLYLCL